MLENTMYSKLLLQLIIAGLFRFYIKIVFIRHFNKLLFSPGDRRLCILFSLPPISSYIFIHGISYFLGLAGSDISHAIIILCATSLLCNGILISWNQHYFNISSSYVCVAAGWILWGEGCMLVLACANYVNQELSNQKLR